MEFATTREPEGAIKTATPGYSGQAPPGDFGAVIGQILARRAQNTVPQAQVPRQATAGRAPAPTQRIYGGGGDAQFGSAPPIPKTEKKIGRYSYGFSGPTWAGTAPHLPTWIGEGREGVDFIMEGGPQNWTGGAMRDPSPSGSPAMDPRMIALRSQQRAASMGSL